MTPTTLAETILRDVPKDALAKIVYDAMRFERQNDTPDWADGGNSCAQAEARHTAAKVQDAVLAALTAALDPAIAERAGEVVDSLAVLADMADLFSAPLLDDDDKPEMTVALERIVAAVPALLAQNAALRAQIAFTATDGQRLLRKIDVIGVCDDPDFCFDSEGSVARCGPCAVKIAARDGVALNEYTRSNPQAMRLRRELTAAEAERDALRAERDRYLRHLTAGAESLNAYKARAEAAEAHNATLTAQVEGLTGALRKAEQDFYEAANRFQDEDYEGPHEKFTVNVVCHIKPYFDMHMKHLRDSAAAACAALSATTEEGHE